VASLTEMVSALYYERRRETAERATENNLRDAAEAHRRIYQAIRVRDADGARRAEPAPHRSAPVSEAGAGGRRAPRQRGARVRPTRRCRRASHRELSSVRAGCGRLTRSLAP
jgi:hypothetical protein